MNLQPNRPAGWIHHSYREVLYPLNQILAYPVAGYPDLELHLIYSADGLYIPALVRKPIGTGPYPVVVVLHGGSGGLGLGYLTMMHARNGVMLDRLHAEGYMVVVTEGRMEYEEAYGQPMEMRLDHQDIISVFRYLQQNATVDPERIGFVGVSHGGELQMKVISELGRGPAALVPMEPAVIEFLGLRYTGVRKESNLQFNAPLRDDQIDMALAQERIDPIDPNLPILIVGRDDDHLQGLFAKLYELLQQAGKRVDWISFDHPDHSYHWDQILGDDPQRDDPLRATVEHVVAFINQHVRGSER